MALVAILAMNRRVVLVPRLVPREEAEQANLGVEAAIDRNGVGLDSVAAIIRLDQHERITRSPHPSATAAPAES
jgi:hypothetical protein